MRSLPVLPQVLPHIVDVPLQPSELDRPWRHLIAGHYPLVFIVDNSQVFEIEPKLFAELQEGRTEAEEMLRKIVPEPRAAERSFEELAEPNAISLNIAQLCNLSCAYCYADEGRFGGSPKLMSEEVARCAIYKIIDASDGRPVTIGFIGGEPFLNRQVLYRSVQYASQLGRSRKVPVRFSITTNATLLRPDDIALLRENAFAVTVSIDGDAAAHDRHRRTRSGAGSHAAIIEVLHPLLQNQGRAKIAARITVTRADMRITERVDALAAIGFREIGVSPLRTSPNPELVLTADDWPVYLAEMVRAAESEQRRVLHGEPFQFSNFALALKEIHRGTCRPLPCGAAANYVSVSVEGDYFTCHRTIDDARFAIGDSSQGLSTVARQNFLKARQVDRQQPCASCWARYLCGGGCHAEVITIGRNGCDYIRGWLEHCLRSYNLILTKRPELFSS